VVVILVLAIIFLWPKKSNPKSNSKISKTGITKADGTFIKMTNLSGRVLVWQPKLGILQVQLNSSGEIKEYLIEPST
jgi:hypothetical protein